MKCSFATDTWKLIPNLDLQNSHMIGNNRNNAIFKNTRPHHAKVPMLTAGIGMDFFNSNLSPGKKNPKFVNEVIKWHPPDSGSVKINFDAYGLETIRQPGF
ncbi:uncharacterized protein LOC126634190 [Malus sylvestris]|uniref:uncharacterized protein LOC126634190 n=1 Tax=Malus sylvestris TaxID=3752 RepID=UPI0021AC3064|nr:uncharacterized protein LOC126634190 [Malus sylvestris]